MRHLLIALLSLGAAVTPAAQVLVKDILPGSASSHPDRFFDLDGTAVFRAYDGENTFLWASDGTEAGTFMVYPVVPAIEHESWWGRVPGGPVFFQGYDVTHGHELWRTDGTHEGTFMVKDIRPGGEGSLPSYPTFAGGTLFFRADDGSTGPRLWVSDGTEGGTHIVDPASPALGAENITPLGDAVLFRAANPATGFELWRSDGTPAGTNLVKDIRPGAASGGPNFLFAGPGAVYFNADDGVHGRELWRSDGTAEGTYLVKDIWPGAQGGLFHTPSFTAFGDLLYFVANDGSHGMELWRTDGTEEGTFMVKDVRPGTGSGVPYGNLLGVANGLLFFEGDDGVHGRELWATDGTGEGTYMVADIAPGEEDGLGGWGAPLDDILVFDAYAPGQGIELWTSDGTEEGTSMAGEIRPGGGGSPILITRVGDRVFFSANDGVHGSELWMFEPDPPKSSDSGPTAGGASLTVFPNPSRHQTTVTYVTALDGHVRVALVDLLGREVSVVLDAWRPAGEHAETFDAAGLGSGVYVLRVEAESGSATRRVTLVR